MGKDYGTIGGMKEVEVKEADGSTNKTKDKPKVDKKKGVNWRLVGWVFGMVAWVGVSLVAMQFLVMLVMLGILGEEKLVQPVWSTVYTAVTYSLTLLWVVLVPWLAKGIKTNREEMGLAGLPTWRDIGLAPVGFAVYFVVAMLVMLVLGTIFPMVDWAQEQNVGFENLFLMSDRILAFLALVVIAPIAEELIFRGWLYGKVRSKLPAWVGIVVVSALFGVLHLGFDTSALQWNVAVNVFCMSVIMCLLREVTGTIWSGILLHMLKNGVAFYILFVAS